MAIVIDAERPHACWACDFRCGLNIIARTEEEGIPDDCPIVGEIPDNHGRIIDEKWVELYILKYFPAEFPNEMEKVYKLLKLALEDVPTVLEAKK